MLSIEIAGEQVDAARQSGLSRYILDIASVDDDVAAIPQAFAEARPGAQIWVMIAARHLLADDVIRPAPCPNSGLRHGVLPLASTRQRLCPGAAGTARRLDSLAKGAFRGKYNQSM